MSIKLEDRKKLAFSISSVMPFGTVNVPATLTHMMRELFEPLDNSAISNVMDDILIATPTSKDHVSLITALFQQQRANGLMGHSPTPKCSLGNKQLKCVIHRNMM